MASTTNLFTAGPALDLHRSLATKKSNKELTPAVKLLESVTRVGKEDLLRVNTNRMRSRVFLMEQLSALGYDNADVLANADELETMNHNQLLWNNVLLDMENDKPKTITRLLEKCQSPDILQYDYSEKDPGQCIFDLMRQTGMTTEQERRFILLFDRYHHNAKHSEATWYSKFILTIRFLLSYMDTEPGMIMADFNVISDVNLQLASQEWKRMKELGLRLPHHIVNYQTGSWTKPSNRGIQTQGVNNFLDLIDAKPKDLVGFKPSDLASLQRRNYDGMCATYNYLTQLGFTPTDIKKAPFSLCFSEWQLKRAMESDDPDFQEKYQQVKQPHIKLNLLTVHADQIQMFTFFRVSAKRVMRKRNQQRKSQPHCSPYQQSSSK